MPYREKKISFWGATVITKLLSAKPHVGKEIVLRVWRWFAVGNATLTRFFALHFLIPFAIAAIVLIHSPSLTGVPTGSFQDGHFKKAYDFHTDG